MEATKLSTLSISLDFGDDADFDFNTLPSEGLPASVRGSSYAPSSFGPHTPSSGRSTPPFSTSFDFSSSFGSSADTVPFDLTPPSSATSTYFPMTPKTGHASNLVYPVFPFTSSRGQLDFSCHPLGMCGNQLTPSQTMDCSFFVNQLGAHQILPTPSAPTQFDHFSDAASHWMYPDSPISFDQPSPTRLLSTVQSIKREPEDDIMLQSATSAAAKKRVLMEEARHRTTALQQQVEQRSPSNARTRVKREKKSRAVVTGSGSFAVQNVERSGMFKCPIAGCEQKAYRRSEHMKRHIQTVHEGTYFKCPFCGHVANRRDNLIAHLSLHAFPRTNSGGGKARVKYIPAARARYEEEMKKNESRRRRNTKSKKRPTRPHGALDTVPHAYDDNVSMKTED